MIWAANILHTSIADHVRLVIMAQVGRNALREDVWREPLAGLEGLVNESAQLQHRSGYELGLTVSHWY